MVGNYLQRNIGFSFSAIFYSRYFRCIFNDRENQIRFKGALCSLDGKNYIGIDESFEYNEEENFGEKFANIILENGGRELMAEIKNQL